MAEIVHFSSNAELNAERNLRAFVELCRSDLTTFGIDLGFDEPIWVVTGFVTRKAKRAMTRLIFSNWDTAGTPLPTMLPEPFLSLAKAYMRYSYAIRPTTEPVHRLMALRSVERALSENGNSSRPSAITSQTLNRAAQLVKERYKPNSAYKLGREIQLLGEFLGQKHLLTVPLRWHSPIRRPQDTVRVGEEFDRLRHAKLPSASALDALARIFHRATEPGDVLASSVAAILCSAPSRINEVLRLAVDCEVHKGFSVPRHATGQTAYGLRWPTSKGASPMIKWIVTSMGSVVSNAIANIRQLTGTAREIARWYEQHPGKIYLPPHLQHLRQQELLTLAEANDVLFMETHQNIGRWCRTHNVPMVKHNGKLNVCFADMERAVIAMLPIGFPVADREQNLKYCEALFVVQKNAMNPMNPAYRCMICSIVQSDISRRLDGRATSGQSSMFKRFGLTEEDGSPITIRTHQFRHYLNTLAQTGGLSQLDIAKWSGRVDVRQNNTYDHQSDRDVNALARQFTAESFPLVAVTHTKVRSRLICRSECGQLMLTSAHTTEYGYCTHDYSLLPCQLHRDCINCTEQVCIKGEAQFETNMRLLVSETRALLAVAERANQQGEAGADRWVEHQRLTLNRAEQLCAILDDPAVPDGTAIQLLDIVPASRLQQAADQRRLKDETAGRPALLREMGD